MEYCFDSSLFILAFQKISYGTDFDFDLADWRILVYNYRLCLYLVKNDSNCCRHNNRHNHRICSVEVNHNHYSNSIVNCIIDPAYFAAFIL